MNRTLKTIYSLALVVSITASALFVKSELSTPEKPVIIVSHFNKLEKKKPSKAPLKPALSKSRGEKKKNKPLKAKVEKIDFLKPKLKEVSIAEVDIKKQNQPEEKHEIKAMTVNNDVEAVDSSELIEHYGFKSNITIKSMKLSWADYLSEQNVERKLASLNEEPGPRMEKKTGRLAKIVPGRNNDKEMIADFVKTVSSQNVNTQLEEEMVFFDYSDGDDRAVNMANENVEIANELKLADTDKEIEIQNVPEVTLASQNKVKHETERKVISPNVLAVIEREMEGAPKVTSASGKVNTQNNPMANRLSEYSKMIDSVKEKKSSAKKMNIQENGYSKTIYTSHEVELGSASGELLRSYEIVSAHDGNKRFGDQNSGSISIEVNLASPRGVNRTTLLKRGYMRTNVDLVLEPGLVEVRIPAISQESMVEFLKNNNVTGFGGFLLVDREAGIDLIDIDSDYEAKFELNENFQQAKDENESRFLLFVGVNPGNALLQVRTFNEEYSQKIIHIVEDEIHFESLVLEEGQLEKITLSERGILAKAPNDLNINPSMIKYFNQKVVAKQMANNLYEIKSPPLLLGMRKYLELSHLGETIYVGMGQNHSLEIPSQDFIVNLLEANDMQGLEGRCLIQVNMAKTLKEVSHAGDSSKGPVGMDNFFLEENGSLSEEPTSLSNKAFFLGDHQGIVNIKLEYVDGSRDYLQSFCSSGTYLVEQL